MGLADAFSLLFKNYFKEIDYISDICLSFYNEEKESERERDDKRKIIEHLSKFFTRRPTRNELARVCC